MKEIKLISLFLFLFVQYSSSQVLPGASPANGITMLGGPVKNSVANELGQPGGVFVDAAGNIYITDLTNDRILKRPRGSSENIIVAGGHGPGAAANQLNSPWDVFVDMAGNIFIADFFNHRIQKWAPGASAGITVAGGNGAGGAANQLSRPSGIFVDAAGDIYISDRNNLRIQKWMPGASFGTTVAGGHSQGLAANQLSFPGGISVDQEDNIYIADVVNNRIQKWAPGASEGTTVAGGYGIGSAANQLNEPNDVSIDANGTIYIADTRNHRIQKWAPGAMEGITVAGGNPGIGSDELYNPLSCFADAEGNIFIADQDRLQKWAPGSSEGITIMGYVKGGPVGVFKIYVDELENIYISDPVSNSVRKWIPGASGSIEVAGGNGAGAAANQLNYPRGIFVDPAGNIYIADANNNRVQKWVPGASEGITVAGGHGNGSAANQLFYPTEVFVDSSGNIYVADVRQNLRIQKWSPGASEGTTVAGASQLGLFSSGVLQYHVFFDPKGNIYVADEVYNRVDKWIPGASTTILVAGGHGSGSAANQLRSPTDLCVDATGNIYIVDFDNVRIQKWAPGAENGVTVAGGNGRGSAPNQFDVPWDVFVTTHGDMYVADAQTNRRVQKFLLSTDYATTCPNLVFVAPSCSEKANISWTEPRDSFPLAISIKNGINPGTANIIYKGLFNGHGYYESTDQYSWTGARDAAGSVGAHLVTISNASENKFVENNFNEMYNYAWIGMYNTGTVGSFAWVTGEPVNYTNWIPGEPNNYYNDRFNPQVFEPYVHINGWDSLSRWNDIGGNENARFLAEFDKAVISYRQISGPANGSSQMAGAYQVCYERTDLRLNKSDTCCFSVTVTCNTPLSNIISAATLSNDNGKDLHISTSPNPSSNYFKLKIVSKNNPIPVNIKVLDMAGRIMEIRNNIYPNQTIDIGRKLVPGIYFVQVSQGNRIIMEKIIRQ